MWNNKTVSVIFPAYNEAPNIARAVTDFKDVVTSDGTPIVDEIITIDNNSGDETGRLAQEAGSVVYVETKQGYGNALMRGLREAKSDLIVLCEPDGTFVANDIVKLLAYAGDFELVCGTRTYPGLVWEDANMPWYLRLGNYGVAKILEVLYWTPCLSDCGCTFRMIHRAAAEKIRDDLFVGRSHFLPNLTIAARLNHLKFIEIPVSYRGRVGDSKITGTFMGIVNTGMAMLTLILTQWPNFVVRMARGRRKAEKTG